MLTKTYSELTIPHGGVLVNCFAKEDELKELQQKASKLTPITVSKRVLCDLEMLAIGAFSPLSGFINKKDYE